ncbi:hypothetical protein PSE_3080 [Pseudovibrio sp. FO-BEG1]|nr:hypothetical protein PSE_3080 [Pseudovibrio sp. FO-BEG1]
MDPANPKGVMKVDRCVTDNKSSLWAFEVVCDGRKVDSGFRASQLEAIHTAEHIYFLWSVIHENKRSG